MRLLTKFPPHSPKNSCSFVHTSPQTDNKVILYDFPPHDFWIEYGFKDNLPWQPGSSPDSFLSGMRRGLRANFDMWQPKVVPTVLHQLHITSQICSVTLSRFTPSFLTPHLPTPTTLPSPTFPLPFPWYTRIVSHTKTSSTSPYMFFFSSSFSTPRTQITTPPLSSLNSPDKHRFTCYEFPSQNMTHLLIWNHSFTFLHILNHFVLNINFTISNAWYQFLCVLE